MGEVMGSGFDADNISTSGLTSRPTSGPTSGPSSAVTARQRLCSLILSVVVISLYPCGFAQDHIVCM